MKMISIAAGLISTMLLPIATFAHPGHGETDGYTIIHYFTEPVHVIATLLSVGVIGLSFRVFRKKREQA
ncbi:hypothetical protein [Flavihumibacter profundi]|jgi:hypothetical protein|uniref:hypothetical protein n=1 Tax=Flavihumibacter profundi TaxID=2716883 RepID=UPI001CC34314|nr:hypothetical protein [Flavihumibacter profundi]MBZ5859339.1 hypothetical protein [Flavihumibacter profundi]